MQHGMNAALAALDRGVDGLFGDGASAAGASTVRPLCECVVMRSPPLEWRYLRRFPVLKRHVFAQWSMVASTQMQTPRNQKQKRTAKRLGPRVNDYKAHGMANLCIVLAQCGMLTVSEGELMRDLVAMAYPEVLRLVIVGKALPLRLRLVLLGFALEMHEARCMDRLVQKWIQDVCEKVLEDVLEAVIQTVSGAASDQKAGKRARKTVAARSSLYSSTDTVSVEQRCAFCRDGATANSLRSPSGGWDFLVASAQRCAQALETADECPATKEAKAALLAFKNAVSTSESTTQPRSTRRRSRTKIPVLKLERSNVGLKITVVAYERLCHVVTDPPPIHQRDETERKRIIAMRLLWESVWRRDLKRFVEAKSLTLADVICHCSKADVFAGMATESSADTAGCQLPGFRVVSEVIQALVIDTPGIITAFLQAWDGMGSGNRTGAAASIPIGVVSPSLKRIQRSYLSQLLVGSSTPQQRRSPSADLPPTQSRFQLAELLYSLYVMFAASIPGCRQDSSYTAQWDILLIQKDWVSSTKQSGQDGMNWCLSLDKCVKGADEGALRGAYFTQALRDYCLTIAYGIIATDGEIITSGGTVRRPLLRVEEDRVVIRRVIAQMMVIFGRTWLAKLIAKVLRTHMSLRTKRESGQRGVKALLFPSLVSYMKASSRANRKRGRTGQQQFIDIVHAVNDILKDSELSSLYLPSLVHFCEAWDVFHGTNTKDPPARANRWGFRAMTDLNMLPELLDCYGMDSVVNQETSDVLVFAMQVLQNPSNCPPTLEGKLFEVLSIVNAAIERSRDDDSGTQTGHGVELVSHSNEVLKRLLRAVKFIDVPLMQRLMKQIKHEVGTLLELKQQLEGWVSCMEMRGTRFIGKESRLEFVLLCNRLLRWFPSDFDSMRLLLSPLDAHLVYAVKAFVKDAGRSDNAVERDSLIASVSSATVSSPPSTVRIDMAIRSYLSAVALPDLAGLTVLLLKSLVKCRSTETYGHLVKIAQKNASILLPEVAIATLSSLLRSVDFLAEPVHQDAGDKDAMKGSWRHRRMKAIVYQLNALQVLAESASIFIGGLPWSSPLFDERSVVIWLPHFFEYVLDTAIFEDSPRATVLIACLERTVDELVLQHSYWLAALLDTALFACSSSSGTTLAALKSSNHDRLRGITRKVLQLLSQSPSENVVEAEQEDIMGYQPCDQSVMLVQSYPAKCVWAKIEEKGLCWSREYLLSDKAAGVVRVCWPGTQEAVDVDKAQTIAVDSAPELQLFVSFSRWMAGALVYSQAFLEDPPAAMRTWERTFTRYVTGLYLPLQFEDDTSRLLKAWLSTWISSNIARGKEGRSLLALLPSQVALYRRLGSVQCGDSSTGSRNADATAVWELIFVGIDLAVDQHVPDDSSRIEQATEVVAGTLTTLELVDLSAAVDFAAGNPKKWMGPLFEQLAKLLVRLQSRACGAAQKGCLLQFPLELLVCCYVCKISSSDEIASQAFLQQVEDVLRRNIGVASMEETHSGEQGGNQTDAKSMKSEQECTGGSDEEVKRTPYVNSVEMEAFFQYWVDKMRLKYDHLNQERCAKVLGTVTAAFAA
ncbi:hypothetical protein BBJ28_00005929 [Nothophytophthora sp. Chile5]|nr:hypothetical protein BBJ28_00005929 [Nothophytophthora sp. Chile5]